MPSQSNTDTGVSTTSTPTRTESPIAQYEQLKKIPEKVCTPLVEGIITPVAKKHFERDRGEKVTHVLPDNTDNYTFESHGFEALVLPDERKVTNQSYNQQVISVNGIIRHPEKFEGIIEQANSLWTDTFGEWKPHVNQGNHPGPFPLADTNVSDTITEINQLYESITASNSLEVVMRAAQDNNYPLLAGIFNTSEEDLLIPGGDDLSALSLMNSYTMPYNDDSLALIAPKTTNTGPNATQRGVIVGHDDTPTGIFAHVTDVTNLDRRKTISRDMVRSAMGFDRELDPWETVDRLTIETGERLRIQGDLRVERVGDTTGFADEIERKTRQEAYTDIIESELTGIDVQQLYVDGLSTDTPITDLLTVNVSETGAVVFDPQVSNTDVELLAYATLLVNVDEGPAEKYGNYDAIPYLKEPWKRVNTMAATDTPTAVKKARVDVQQTIDVLIEPHEARIAKQARDAAAEAKAGMDVPKQVNLPVDNHMAFIESGYAPDTDEEPIPVAIPDETTLHIVHDEHNTVNAQITPGLYRFSLLPRGLQPEDNRPQW